MFAWDVKANDCWALSTNILYSSLLTTSSNVLPLNLSAHNLNFHWRWRWQDRIKTIILNIFFFNWIIEYYLSSTSMHIKCINTAINLPCSISNTTTPFFLSDTNLIQLCLNKLSCWQRNCYRAMFCFLAALISICLERLNHNGRKSPIYEIDYL